MAHPRPPSNKARKPPRPALLAGAFIFTAAAFAADSGEEPSYVRNYREALPALYADIHTAPTARARAEAAYRLARKKWEVVSIEACALRVLSLRNALQSDEICSVQLMAAWSLTTLGSAAGAEVLRSHLREQQCQLPPDHASLLEAGFVEGLLANVANVPCGTP